MVDNISSNNPLPSNLQHIYKQDFIEGANLFQQSLSQYQQSSIPAQKEAFKDVMQKAMTVMNETAKLCLSKEAQKQEAKLSDDFSSFQENGDPKTLDSLSKDIKNLQRYL